MYSLSRDVALPFLFFNDTATTEIYTLSLHDALPILDPVQHAARDHGLHPALADRPALDEQPARPRDGRWRRAEGLLHDPDGLRHLGLHRDQPGPTAGPDPDRSIRGRRDHDGGVRARLVRESK